MNLFISYGHDRNVPLVQRVKRDLKRRKHCCWIDSDGLRKPDAHDWRRALMSALTTKCDWTVGFLSQHAMRLNGVTAQELAIARDLKAGCVSTVLVEKQVGWQVPVAVGRAQWVDMSDWQEMQSQGEAVFEAWYAPKFAELANRLTADHAEAYAHEIGMLETWLEPVPQKADIDQHLEGFVGRDWLIKKLDNWRLQNVHDRLFWLAGAPGSGKTAFSAWITATHQANVVALNLCHYKLRDRCDAARVVRTLAFFLCRGVEDYRLLLLQLMPKFDRDRLSQSNASSLFDQLIAQPLAHCFDGNLSADRLLIVIDGLDEAVDNEKLVGETAISFTRFSMCCAIRLAGCRNGSP